MVFNPEECDVGYLPGRSGRDSRYSMSISISCFQSTLVTTQSPNRSGRFIARAHTANPQGGAYLPGVLAADTLDTLRTMLPRGDCGKTGPS